MSRFGVRILNGAVWGAVYRFVTQSKSGLARAFHILHPSIIAALLTVSGAAVLLNACRVVATGHWGWFFLSWNLFLAWVPLTLAWLVCFWSASSTRWSWKVWAGGMAWLLFLPNAYYIFTDLVHLGRSGRLYWLDMMLISLFALTALVLGFVSLRLMHQLVSARWGWVTGWFFAVLSAGLIAVGVFIGRFLRWNSWDAVLNPWEVMNSLLFPTELPTSRLKFTILFAVFVFLTYLMLYALTLLGRHRQNQTALGNPKQLQVSECRPG